MTKTAAGAVRVRGLRKGYGDVTALCGIDLDIQRGEVFALLGPNGAGKTTAIEIMAGYRKRDAGEVSVLGTDPASGGRAGRSWRARIGVVAQSASDLPDLSIADIARHFAGYYPAPADASEALAAVGLSGVARSRPRQLADASLEAEPAQPRRHLALAAEAAREGLAEARALVTGLAPAQLAAGTIDDALGRLASRIGPDLSGGADFEVGGVPRSLATGTEVVLLRVCQEALANVRKHAAARRASVRLAYGEDEVRLEICDDGAGFDPDRVNGGYGLRGMRSRAAEAGGTLTVRSSPGAGTSVRVAVPG